MGSGWMVMLLCCMPICCCCTGARLCVVALRASSSRPSACICTHTEHIKHSITQHLGIIPITHITSPHTRVSARRRERQYIHTHVEITTPPLQHRSTTKSHGEPTPHKNLFNHTHTHTQAPISQRVNHAYRQLSQRITWHRTPAL